MGTDKVKIPLDDTMDNPQERPEAELGWLAGCFESDGWFSLHKNNCHNGYYQYQPVCGVVNTDPLYMMSVVCILKKNNIPHYLTSRAQLGIGTKVLFQVLIQGLKRCKRFLPLILPYIRGSKSERVEIMLEFINYRLSITRNQPYGDVEDAIFERFQSAGQIRLEGIFNDYTSDTSIGA